MEGIQILLCGLLLLQGYGCERCPWFTTLVLTRLSTPNSTDSYVDDWFWKKKKKNSHPEIKQSLDLWRGQEEVSINGP